MGTLGAGATATLACLNRLQNHDVFPEGGEFPAAEAYPSKAKFKFGNGGMEKLGFAANVPAGIEARQGKSPRFWRPQVSRLLRVKEPCRRCVGNGISAATAYALGNCLRRRHYT